MSGETYSKLKNSINQYTLEEQLSDFSTDTMNRNIRDVLAHLHHWHLLFLDWSEQGMAGVKPDMPAKGYTWKTTPELNRWIWEKYQSIDLKEVKKLLESSYKDIQTIIHKHTNEELFEKKRYFWTGSTSLGSYLVSATSSHYEWAFKMIKKGRK